MNDMVLIYIVQAILGGASGYITNDYAINMLFKEYTPLKIGGVIKKTRPEFIENLSSMVENDIINKEKINEVLENEEFKIKLDGLTTDFFKHGLYEAFKDNTFSQIEGFETTLKETDIFAKKVINNEFSEIYNLLINNISDKLLSTEQKNKIIEFTYKTIIDFISKTDIIETLLLKIYYLNENIRPNDFIDKNIINNLINNLNTKILLNNPNEIRQLLETVGIFEAAQSLLDSLSNKKISDVINIDKELLNIINNKVIEFINSEKVVQKISILFCSLFSYLKNCNISVYQLLDSSFEDKLKLYLKNNIPYVTVIIIDWINTNSNSINKIIEDSIDELINESDGLKAKLLSIIKNTYFNYLGNNVNIANKIIEQVTIIFEPETLSQNLSDKAIDFLDNLEISNLVEQLENNLTSQDATKLIVEYITNNSDLAIEKMANYICKLQLNVILKEFQLNEDNVVLALQELFTSKKYISKLNNYANNLLTKRLKDLISDDKAREFIKQINDFIINRLMSEERELKKWLHKKLTTPDLNSLKSQQVTKLINEEVYKLYAKNAKTLGNTKIVNSLDKLNKIEGIIKRSSESVHSYAIKNTDTILKGTIKTIVSDNLNKLNDDEFVDVANDFIGKELKPIMFFGGVLGIVAGIILASFQSPPLVLGEINFVNMVVYAFVGFITNVIAINMLFKPYKENKLLSKIPFLNNFSQGYIVKNQKTFAKKTASFIDKNLLSKNSINELFSRNKDKIKDSFLKNIRKDNYKVLTNFLVRNKQSVINKLFNFIKSTLFNKIVKISSSIYLKLGKIKLSKLLTDKTINNMSHKLSSAIINVKNYSEPIHSFITENSINIDGIANIQRNVERHYNNVKEITSDKNIFTDYILKYNEKYIELTNKKVEDIFSLESRENLSHRISNKGNELIKNKDLRERIYYALIKELNNSIDDKSFEDLCNGKFKSYVDLYLPQVLDKLINKLVENIKESKNKTVLSVQKEIKNNLGFLEKGVYNLVGGDAIISEIIEKIMVEKAPKLIENQKSEFNSIIVNIINEKFYKTKVNDLYTGVNNSQLNELIDNYIINLYTVSDIKINNLIESLTIKVSKINLNELLKLFNLDSISSIIQIYETELEAFLHQLSLTLENNKEETLQKLNSFIEQLFMNLFKDLPKEDVEIALHKLIEEINKNSKVEELICQVLSSNKKYFENKFLSEAIDKENFIEYLENYLLNLASNSEFEKVIKNSFNSIIDEIIYSNFNFIDSKTKDHLANIFVDACLNSLKRNLEEILKTIEFDKIAQEEIEKMDPKKIHEMFDSFCGKYFKRLMLYGFGGFVFGINLYIGFTLTTLKILSELFNRENE